MNVTPDTTLLITGAPTRCWSVKDVVGIQVTVGSRDDSTRPESFEAGCVPSD